MINLLNEATKPKKLAIGMHSFIENWKNIKRKGIRIPPPPIPPTFVRNTITKVTTNPESSKAEGGKIMSFILKFL